jgi:hypothetical protein
MAAGGALAAAATGRRSTTTRITGLLLANVARNLQFACARHLIHIKRTERKTNCSSLGLSAAAISDRGSLNRAAVVALSVLLLKGAAAESGVRMCISSAIKAAGCCLQKQPCSQKIKLYFSFLK